jgi:G3E family GTPase
VAANQGALADRRLITKTDLADAAAVAALTERLTALNPGAAIRPVNHGAIDAADLFGMSLYDPKKGQAQVHRWLDVEHYRATMAQLRDTGHGHPPDHHHDHHDGHHHDPVGIRVSSGGKVRTWLLESDRPLDWNTVRPRIGHVINTHGDAMLRMKGILWTADDPRPLVIHGVQRLFHSPVRIERWPDRPRNTVVVIGTENAQEGVALLAEALAAEPAAAH